MDTTYAPKPDGRPDPGEVVWAWVPYEDDSSQGKDRPVSWDSEGRPSEVRTNRLIRLDPTSIRREGAVLDETRYDAVIAEIHRRTPEASDAQRT